MNPALKALFLGAGKSKLTPAGMLRSAPGAWLPVSIATVFSDTAATAPTSVNGKVGALVPSAGTMAKFTQGTSANQPILRGTPKGPNLIASDGNFQTPANWTAGTGWSVASTRGTATTATSTLAPVSSPAAVAGKVYLVRMYVTQSAGSVAITWGGTTGSSRTVTGMHEEFMTASTTGGLSIAGTGFSGDVSQIQIFAADAADVSAPYWLEFNGSSTSLSAANSINGYPFTFAVRALRNAAQSGTNSGWWSLYQTNSDDKWMDSANLVDNHEATPLVAEPTTLSGVSLSLIGEYGPALTARADMVPSSTAANTNSFGTKASAVIGYANPGTYQAFGRMYAGMLIGRQLSETEKVAIDQALSADLSVVAWGNSLVAGTGVTTPFNWPNRLTRVHNHQSSNQGVGGQTSTQIATRFFVDTSNTKKWINIFQVVENDNWSTNGWGPTEANINSMIASVQGAGRWLVLGGTMASGSSTITAAALTDLDNYMKANYGARFVDVRAYLQSKNNGSPQDLSDVAAGLVPTSLRSDTLHWNDLGYQYAADLIYSTIVQLGWVG